MTTECGGGYYDGVKPNERNFGKEWKNEREGVIWYVNSVVRS